MLNIVIYYNSYKVYSYALNDVTLQNIDREYIET